jgi:hypothetical protein
MRTIDNLREVAWRCRAGEQLPAELAAWLGRSLEDFLFHRRRSVDEAFGLQWARGGVAWWMEEAIRARNAALRELARRFHPLQTVSAQARSVYSRSLRYAASAWLRDRNREEMPPQYGGTPHEWLWRAFDSGAAMPVGERHLRHILGR